MTNPPHKSPLLIVLLLLTSAILAACNFPGMQATPDVFATAAAGTVSARLTERASGQPPVATTPPIPPPLTMTPTQTQTTIPPSATRTLTATSTPTEIPCDRAGFITDVTIPDGEEIAGGTAFTKTWRLRNTGSCTWTSSYSLVFHQGDSMGGPASVQLTSGTVPPGQTVDVSVNLTAPNTPGTYKGFWKLRNGSGVLFGVGASGNVAFWVEIEVPEPVVLEANFSPSYQNTHDCGTLKYATFRINNNGDFDFESLYIRIVDTDTSTPLYIGGTSDIPFMTGENDCPPGGSKVEPGDVRYIAASIGAVPPSGNNAQATIKLCTQDSQAGTCLQKAVNFVVP
jgi:hypothetical protein